jgi:transposase-like protein
MQARGGALLALRVAPDPPTRSGVEQSHTLNTSAGTLPETGGKNPGRRARVRSTGAPRRLTPEQKWRIFLEASRENTTDVELCRRSGITRWQLRAIRERAQDASAAAFGREAGRAAKDPEIVELRTEVERTSRALKELAIENTLLRGRVNGG